MASLYLPYGCMTPREIFTWQPSWKLDLESYLWIFFFFHQRYSSIQATSVPMQEANVKLRVMDRPSCKRSEFISACHRPTINIYRTFTKCADFSLHFSPHFVMLQLYVWSFSEYSSLLPQSKDMQVRVTGHTELPVWMWMAVCLHLSVSYTLCPG